MKLTDGKRTVEITIMMWEKDHYTPDSSIDFFDAGSLPFDADADAYVVKDVEYCIEQAHDWQKGIGDYYDDEWLAYQAERGIERCVFVTDEVTPSATNYNVDEYGRKHYPSGDYSEIDSFDDECSFWDCSFAKGATFGSECSYYDGCVLD